MRVLRRRLGLTQRELAYLIGYDSDSAVSHLESGSRTPHLAEVLVIELVFGVPALVIFPEIRESVGERISHRLKRLTSELRGSIAADSPRVSYKTAQLERVLASLRTPDDAELSEKD